jgi:hypothetical protein
VILPSEIIALRRTAEDRPARPEAGGPNAARAANATAGSRAGWYRRIADLFLAGCRRCMGDKRPCGPVRRAGDSAGVA